jgi:ABC-type lipoprotein export system ATPase subunit
MSKILLVKDLCKEYPLPRGTLRVFDRLNFDLENGSLVAVMGVSGVGKTTLLNLFGLLDKPTRGKVFLDGEDIFAKDDIKKALIRNKKVGFIFQFYHLLPEFSAWENVSFPLLIKGVKRKEAQVRAVELLKEVGLEDKVELRPGQLSGGEQQRIAIARALINNPKLLLADEPTGNLDWKTGRMILELIRQLHIKKNLSSIIVTHNEKVAQFCDKNYLMQAGGLTLI